MSTLSASAKDPAQIPRASGGFRHFAALTISAVLLAVTFAVIPGLPAEPSSWIWLQFLSGAVLCPTLILVAVHHGYLLARRRHWPKRRNAEQDQVAALRIPAEVKKPETFAGVAPIDAAQKAALIPIPDAQGRFRARALTTYASPPVAILLIGLQLTLWPHEPFGAGLVLGQALLVFFVLLRVLVDRKPTEAWIEQRTRGELFRREQYLALACVGPYFPGRLTGAKVRIDLLRISSVDALWELVPMEYEADKDRASWLDHLASHPGLAPLFDDLSHRIATYQYYRAGKQIAWMRSAAADSDGSAKRLEWLIGIAAACTVLTATVSSFLILSPPAAENGGGGVLLQSVVAMGALLPALGGMLLALQSVFNLRFLTESYRLAERALERLRSELVELQEEVARTWAGASDDQRRSLGTRFQRLVLRAEAELTQEYVRWRMVTQRDVQELV
jgi:hypothetical protein